MYVVSTVEPPTPDTYEMRTPTIMRTASLVRIAFPVESVQNEPLKSGPSIYLNADTILGPN